MRQWTEGDCLKVEELLQKISGKHTLHLLAILALYGEKSFGQLRKEMDPISAKVLNQCLNQLKSHGLISNRREMQGQVAQIILRHSRPRKVLADTRRVA